MTSPNRAQPIRVIIAEDQPIVREGLASFLSLYRDVILVDQAEDGEHVVALYKHHRPDVVLLDMMMPGLSGLETLHKLKAVDPECRVIALTNYNDSKIVRAAIDAGALGYLLKDVSGDRLAEAVRRVYRREPVLSPSIISMLVEYPDRALGQTEADLNLTVRELDVLNLVADGQTNAEIAYKLGIKPSTVKTYLRRIMTKLDANSRMEAVTLAIRHGIIRI